MNVEGKRRRGISKKDMVGYEYEQYES